MVSFSDKAVLPFNQIPIAIVGAGGIVNDAHLPAYKIAGFEVQAITDCIESKAVATAGKFGIPDVYTDLYTMIQNLGNTVIYDLALPGSELLSALELLPDHSFVLMQKPMGNDYDEAKKVLELCRRKELTAAVNFQLRYAPAVLAARSIIAAGLIGHVCDIEVYVNVYTPWHLWTFLYELPRVEILYHSIHYIDLIRSFLGNPQRVFAKTTKHPQMQELASVKSNIILDYGDMTGANILTNHCHNFGLSQQDAYIKIEGTGGAIKIGLGTLMNYPQGVPDSFHYVIIKNGEPPVWQSLPVQGTWFPHAFIGSMAEVMRAAEGTIRAPDNSVEDCIYTMACVEAAYGGAGPLSGPLSPGGGT